jgi:hypothetical protein
MSMYSTYLGLNSGGACTYRYGKKPCTCSKCGEIDSLCSGSSRRHTYVDQHGVALLGHAEDAHNRHLPRVVLSIVPTRASTQRIKANTSTSTPTRRGRSATVRLPVPRCCPACP